ncbi:hypothetical protein F5Y15DRAFT_380746 [Xylariaceae sp. FL0016]|nr:hypothetical protein F5Y15DRAFT_380746 [Xylariaceae sp. FL0016]
MRACVVCAEGFDDDAVVQLACSHNYCHGCIQDLFDHSLGDGEKFPTECCEKVPITPQLARILGPEVVCAYFQKRAEFEAEHKIYCPNPQCSRFIPSTNVSSDLAACPDCQEFICTKCEGSLHDGPCPVDSANQQLEKLARENGWGRCPGCQNMVEKNGGCNHMICRCGWEFGYMYFRIWGECKCPDGLQVLMEQMRARFRSLDRMAY